MENSKICASLVAAQREFEPLLKKNANPFFRSRYADLASVCEVAITACNNNGIFVMQKPSNVEGGVCVETIFFHESGESMSGGVFFVPIINNEGDKKRNDAQAYGSGMTYARRYGLMAALCIAAEDDDGNAASGKKQQAKQDNDPYKDYVEKTLPMLKDAAMLGLQNLQTVFKNIESTPYKSALWKEHSASLKKAAGFAEAPKQPEAPSNQENKGE